MSQKISSLKGRKVILAVLCSLVIAGCAMVWLPSFIPAGTGEDAELEHRVTIFRQLQSTLESFHDLELAYSSFMRSGKELDSRKFGNTMLSVEHQFASLRTMTRGETVYAEKVRALQNRLSIVLSQLEQVRAIRAESTGSGSEAARNYLETNGTAEALEDVKSRLRSLELDEVEYLKQLVGQYKHLVFSGEFPWIAVVIGSSVLAILLLSLSRADAARVELVDYRKRAQDLEAELVEARDNLERLTHLDVLTGVLNSRGLEHVLRAEESRVGRSGTHLVAVLVDCDNFKEINGAVGVEAADVVLRDVARRIVGTLRPSDHVARVGGDEFLVLLPDTQLAFGIKVAERIRAAVYERQNYNLTEGMEVSVSIGVATIPLQVATTEEAIDVARAALVRGKASGRNRISLSRGGGESYLDLSPAEVVERLRNVSNYRVVYLPFIDLLTKEVVGFEILTRGPDGAFENPADLFRLCVENDVLTEVDMICLKLGLDMTREIASGMRVHLNLFPSTILEIPVDDLIAMFPKERAGRTFWLEISESNILGEPSNFRGHVAKLREAGILVAVDDIGFSRQSLETLMLLEPDAVKVDRAYVAGISKDKAKLRLLTRLVNVAKSLGSEVIAEGVECEDEIPVLTGLGVTVGQGFLFGGLLDVIPGDPLMQKQRVQFMNSEKLAMENSNEQ